MQVFFECDLAEHLREFGSDEQSFIGVSYVAEMESLLVVTSQGYLLSRALCVESVSAVNTQSQVEPVGDIEGGILTCAWSNDQEMLLIVTSSGSLVLLNNSFEVLNEGHLEDVDPAAKPDAVHISWRSDSEYFCVSYPSSQRQQMCVYSKELQLHSVWYSVICPVNVVATSTTHRACNSSPLCPGIQITLL